MLTNHFKLIFTAFLLSFSLLSPAQDKNNIYQYSVISALMQGNYDGELTIGELKQKGNLGLGTLNHLDGELVVIDGKYFQVNSEGKITEVPSDVLTPFAVVTDFQAEVKKTVQVPQSYKALTMLIDSSIGSLNLIHAFKITGTFSYVKTRSVPAQVKPYKKLVEVTKNQPVFEYNNVKGTIVGFRFPSYTEGINVPGYHLHFISDDKTGGGHVLDFTTDEVTIEYAKQNNFNIAIPDTGDFLHTDLSKTNAEDIHKAEK